MNGRSRREFLANVGRGMLVASLGSTMALELGLSPSLADGPVVEDLEQRVTFGKLEPLVSIMQETLPERLLPLLVERLRGGESLKALVAAAALANVRAFAGQDYIGYHTFMALVPAYQMAAELSEDRRPLPILKVLYRNSSRIHEQGAGTTDTLHQVAADKSIGADRAGELLREDVRALKWNAAESKFAALAQGPAGEAFNHLQYTVQDEVDVHRVVLSWRAWSMLGLTDRQFADTLLRQSVRYCLQAEQQLSENNRPRSAIRDTLPRLLDQYKLLARPVGQRKAEDADVEQLAATIFSGSREQAAEAAAAALADGIDPEDVGQAISLAANRLVLHDPGRRPEYSTPQKPAGCVHGDSVGVHASDAANAWRNIARVSNPRNLAASLIVGAFHTAGQTNWITDQPYPYVAQLEDVRESDADGLLARADDAIRNKDQAQACAAIHRYSELQLPERPVFDLLLRYAVSEDGALHAEKYYRTVVEEFAAARPAFRWRQLIALARVTASEYGFAAPGYQDACALLGLG